MVQEINWMDNDQIPVGVGIKKIRELQHMTVEELDRRVGLIPSIELIERGLDRPNNYHFNEICKALNVQPVIVIRESIDLDKIVDEAPEHFKEFMRTISKLLNSLYTDLEHRSPN